MTRPLARLVLACMLVPCLASRPRADVIVVDASGGGEFTSLVSALAAAVDGDTLLVRPGNYVEFGSSFLITGRSLVVAGDGTGAVLMNATTVNVPAGKRVVLRNLTIESAVFDSQTTGLAIVGGDVFVEDCTILGRDGHSAFTNTFGGKAVTAASTRLVFSNCTLEGGRGSDSEAAVFLGAQPGGYGIDVFTGATVAFYGCTVKGGRGGDFVPSWLGPGNGNVGGIALRADFGGSVLLAGSVVQGGDGGHGDQDPGAFGPGTYAGGDALNVDGGTVVTRLDTLLVPGAPGHDGGGTFGTPGDAIDAAAFSTLIEQAGTYRGTAFGAPVGEGDVLTLGLTGEPGDLFALFVSGLPAVPLPSVKLGLFHLGAPLLGPFVTGPLGPSGALALSVPAPDLGFGPDGSLLIHAQAFVKPASGPTLLSGATTLLVVDDGL